MPDLSGTLGWLFRRSFAPDRAKRGWFEYTSAPCKFIHLPSPMGCRAVLRSRRCPAPRCAPCCALRSRAAPLPAGSPAEISPGAAGPPAAAAPAGSLSPAARCASPCVALSSAPPGTSASGGTTRASQGLPTAIGLRKNKLTVCI